MKIAVSSNTNSLDGLISGKLDRAKFFILFETEAHKFHFLKNNVNSDPSTIAREFANNYVEVIIAESCGPKLHKCLDDEGIKIYTASDMTIMKAIEKLKENRLKEATLLGNLR